jgi:hypothetical protein
LPHPVVAATNGARRRPASVLMSFNSLDYLLFLTLAL